jgi:hypothetical protein
MSEKREERESRDTEPLPWSKSNSDPNMMYIRGYKNIVIQQDVRELRYSKPGRVCVPELLGDHDDFSKTSKESIIKIIIYPGDPSEQSGEPE